MQRGPDYGHRAEVCDTGPRILWSLARSQCRVIEGLESVRSERLLRPAREARHALGIVETFVPASFIFADSVTLFFLTKETRIAEDGTLSFRWQGADRFQQR